jgi:arylformamidase
MPHDLRDLLRGRAGMIRDISPPLRPRTPVWPGDVPLSRHVACDLARGDTITLSSLGATVHLGAHADAPSHFLAGGASIDAVPLDRYVGPCRVVDVDAQPGSRFGLGAIGDEIDAPRLLLRILGTPPCDDFPTGFPAPSAALVEELAGRGVVLIGLDTPSVDLFDSKDLPAHHACARGGVAILEGLDLSAVAPGRYELIALPLRLEGFDASPVRAILRDLEP